MYGVVVAKNKAICGSVDSCFNTEKALLTSKRNPLMLFLEWTWYHDWVIQVQTFLKNKNKKKKTKRDFTNFWFGTLPVFLTPTNGSAGLAICSSP